jgi:hypothetical protein
MKSALWILAAAALVMAGCDKKSASTTTPSTNSAAAYNKAISNNSSGNPLTAPVDYLGTLAKGKQSSEKTIELASLNQAVQLFYAQEGRYPKDLNELVKEKYLPKIPDPPYGTKMSYDAAEGKVKIVPQ